MNIGSPFAILIIIYTDKSHRIIRVRNEVDFVIFSAISMEKVMQKIHFNILSPSREDSGRRLKIERQSESIEKGKRKLWIRAIL